MSHLVGYAEGANGQIQLFEDRIQIQRKGILSSLGLRAKQTDIPLAQIGSVEFKSAGTLTNGYIQFVYLGQVPKTGLVEVRNDENSVLFRQKQQPVFERVKSAVQEQIATLKQDQVPPDINEPVRLATIQGKDVLSGSGVCSKCGRELPGGSKFCAFCGTTIGEEAKPVTGKPPKDTSKKKTPKGCVIGCIVLGILAIVGILVAVFGRAGTSYKELYDMMPTSVPGFHLSNGVGTAGKVEVVKDKDSSIKATLVNHFEPDSDSVYFGKVADLTLTIMLFKDEVACKTFLDADASSEHAVTMMVDGEEVQYSNNLEWPAVEQQRGKYLVSSDALNPYDAAYDEAVLKQAAIDGFRAIGP